MAKLRDKKGRPVVVITGMGIVSPLGSGKEDNWKRLTAGESGIRSITRFSTEGLRTTISGAVDHAYEQGMVSSELSEKLARHAGNEAIEQSGIAKGNFPGPFFLAFPPIEIHYNTSEAHRDIAEVIAAGWKRALGIEVKLQNQEWKVYLDTQQTLAYDLSRSSWIADYADPNT